jgi:hypothetical protein
MQYLTVVGESLDHCRDQAAMILGPNPNIIDTGFRENVDYFQFNTDHPVQSPINAFQAGIPGATVCVLWVLVHP